MKKITGRNHVTKRDIQELRAEIKAQRTDSKRGEKSLRKELLRVEERVENIEESQKRTEVTLNKISDQLDGFVGTVNNLAIDNEVGADQIHEVREEVKDHEKRISKLESSQTSPQ